MTQSEPLTLSQTALEVGNARGVLARRLADLICLPSSVISPQERWIVGDLLHEILRNSDARIRKRCAQRLAEIKDAPANIVKLLAADAIDIAEPLLSSSGALSDFDLMEIARLGTLDHRVLIARRDGVSETVTAALASLGEPAVVHALLKNAQARFAAPTVSHIVSLAQDDQLYVPALLKRPELRPRAALQLFWTCNTTNRKAILARFAVSRTLMIEAADGVFAMAAGEGWSDPLVNRALRFVDRRQRNREAAEESSYGSLEGLIANMQSSGVSRDRIGELGLLAGISDSLALRICEDLGGEPLAILCKATGADRSVLDQLCSALSGLREGGGRDRAMHIYDGLSVEKAQTVLRYWDWSKAGSDRTK
ncbi:DUF2336 domain-containing protein [Hyphobacterium sp.]|uniref:DUF2336 domain-containing protein n=1 Tax=Hyphobacterium sp. TaxID=2004662 RepID=UPI003BACA930